MIQATYKTVKPAFPDKDAVPVVLASDDNYGMFLEVVLASLIKHASTDNYYDINILSFNISDGQKAKIQSLAASNNISIRLFDVDKLIDISGIKSISHHRISFATVFRLYISALFPDYKKMVYLDVDVCLKDDIASFYKLDLDSMAIGGIRDKVTPPDDKDITRLDYCNAGILLIDIKNFHRVVFPDNNIANNVLVNDLLEHKYPYLDQDVINKYFKNNIKVLDQSWNFAVVYGRNKRYSAISENVRRLTSNPELIKIVHYSSNIKPWISRYAPLDEYWWEEAKSVPSYDKIIAYHQKAIARYQKNAFTVFIYLITKILVTIGAAITLGKVKHVFRNKKQEYKTKIYLAKLYNHKNTDYTK